MQTTPKLGNLFAGAPAELPAELVETLVSEVSVRIERIVSRGHASAPGFWYDQPQHEWVVVISGAARLRFEGDESDVALAAGDHVLIPARRRHRVEWTPPDVDTIWLAVHYD